MYDWQFEEDGSHAKPKSTMRFRRRWLLAVPALLIVLALAGYGIARWRAQQRMELLRSDLAKAISFEAEIQKVGDRTGAEDVYVREAPAGWRTHYLDSFDKGGDENSGAVSLAGVDFRDDRAVVIVSIGGRPQLRQYSYHRQRWLRAPLQLDAWGSNDQIELSDELALSFRDQDRAFAEMLAADFLTLSEVAKTSNPNLDLQQLAIEPHELVDPILKPDPHQLIINSPFVQGSAGQAYSPAKLRYALAKNLLEPETTVSSLPGRDIVLSAILDVVAYQWAYRHAVDDRLASWRQVLQDAWVSPFYGTVVEKENGQNEATTETEIRQKAAAAFLARVIYEHGGLQSVSSVLSHINGAEGWDEVFQAALAKNTYELEIEAAALAMDAAPDVEHAINLTWPNSLRMFFGELDGNQRQWFVDPDTQLPILVEFAGDEQLVSSAGDTLSAACLKTGTRVEPQGRWLEAGRRMLVYQMVLDDGEPLFADALSAVPAGAQALVASSVDEQLPSALAVLNYGGKIESLPTSGVLSGIQSVVPVGGSTMDQTGSLQLLLTSSIDECGRTWHVLYDLAQGVVDGWAASSKYPFVQGAIRRGEMEPLLLVLGSSASQAETIWVFPDSTERHSLYDLPHPMTYLGWSPLLKRIVVYDLAEEKPRVGMIDPETGAEVWLDIVDGFFPEFQLSSDGRWLGYLQNFPGESRPRLLRSIDLLSLSDDEVMTAEPGSYYSLAQAMGERNPDTLLVELNQRHRDTFTPIFLELTPANPQSSQIIVQGIPGETIATPILCSDGSWLYPVHTRLDTYQVRANFPGSPPGYMRDMEHFILPLSCLESFLSPR